MTPLFSSLHDFSEKSDETLIFSGKLCWLLTGGLNFCLPKSHLRLLESPHDMAVDMPLNKHLERPRGKLQCF